MVSDICAEIRDFRQATMASFNALREGNLDLRRQMTDGFAEIHGGFTEMRGKFDAAAAGHQQVVGLLNTLIAREHGE